MQFPRFARCWRDDKAPKDATTQELVDCVALHGGGLQERLRPRRPASHLTPGDLPLTTRKAVALHVGDARRALAAELHLLLESGPADK
jgi:hypothetical protein